MKNKLVSSFSWAFAERITKQVASFVVSIVLARLLEPSVYGLLAMANIVIAFVNAATHTGFGTSLIRKKEASNTDFSSTLYFSFGVGVLAYLGLFFASPLIASFFDNEELIPVIRWAAIPVITASVSTVQHAYIIRKMQFKLFFYSSLFGSITSAVLGIYLAYRGFGVWALIAQSIIRSCTDIIVLAFLSDWRPKLVFSLQSIKEVYGFGWKVVVSSVLNAFYDQLRSLVIGKKYTSADLAYYDKGHQFPVLIVNNVDNTIANVLISSIAKLQDDMEKLLSHLRRSIRTSSSIIFPLLVGMGVCAEPIVRVLLTDKWLPSVPYLQMLSVAIMMKPVLTAKMQGFLAIGRSDVTLRIQVTQKVLGVTILLVCVLLGTSPLLIAAGEIASYVAFMLIPFPFAKKHLQYSYRQQTADFLPQLLISCLMGAVVFVMGFLPLSPLVILILQVPTGAVLYVLFAYLFRVVGVLELVGPVFKSLKGKLKHD